ncbi:MAG: hypothetical protein AAGA12_11755 [Pseudomonadota bacterium]
MQILIPTGAVITLLGLAGLIWCILRVAKAKKAASSEDELRAALQSNVALNLGALCVSAIGLMMVIFGIMFS